MTRGVQRSAIVVFCFEKWCKNVLLIFLADSNAKVNNTEVNAYHFNVCGSELTLDLYRTIFR